jgi:DNA-binding CsgD family transcriptional regulator
VVALLLSIAKTALYLVILLLALQGWRREPTGRTRPLWLVLVLAMLAQVVGGLYRVAVNATRAGWLDHFSEDLLNEWQVGQSILTGIITLFAYVTIRKVTTSMRSVERIAGTMFDRVRGVELDPNKLTARERHVLSEIGAGRLTDAELADRLHIAESTVQSHVKSLRSKFQVRRRTDLAAIAHLLELNAGRPSPIKGRGIPRLRERFHRDLA